MQRCRKGRHRMTNVLPFAEFSRAMRFESSTILREWPFCRNALRSPGRAIKIRTERHRVKTAQNRAWTERNRAWTKRNRVWIRARHEDQSPNVDDHRVAGVIIASKPTPPATSVHHIVMSRSQVDLSSGLSPSQSFAISDASRSSDGTIQSSRGLSICPVVINSVNRSPISILSHKYECLCSK